MVGVTVGEWYDGPLKKCTKRGIPANGAGAAQPMDRTTGMSRNASGP